MHSKYNTPKKQSGMTIIELLIVFIFSLVILSSTFLGYKKLTESSDIRDISQNTVTTITDIRGLYQNSATFAGVTLAVLIPQNVFPDVWVDRVANLVTNDFGGMVTIVPNSLGAGVNNAFDFTNPLVPREICTKFVANTWGAAAQIQVNGVVVKAFGANATADPAVISAACNVPANTVIHQIMR